MEIDSTTLADLGIFTSDADKSIFEKLDFTTTSKGKEQLYKNLKTPLLNVDAVRQVQKTVGLFSTITWPTQISNGSIMVLEKLYFSQIDTLPRNASAADAIQYQLLHGHDFKLLQFTIKHLVDFLKGMDAICDAFAGKAMPTLLANNLVATQNLLQNKGFAAAFAITDSNKIHAVEVIRLAYNVLHESKFALQTLKQQYAQFDAWHSMAIANKEFKLTVPEFTNSSIPNIEAIGLYHLLLPKPIAYNITLNEQQNFLFLTGANMAGKSTFIKACGAAVYLAHTGFGVPAQSMQLSFFDGILSNINVQDDITKGESYFYNEVQRIKATVQKINNGKNWFILIDELFKGTNVEDAMKCSSTVIEGLLKIKQSLFILSTHLYEIGHSLQKHSNICFNYFETTVDNEQLSFSYQLKPGISNDRLGYLILKREGVVEMLEKLA
jgi:DNA mismatch repair protein MutS